MLAASSGPSSGAEDIPDGSEEQQFILALFRPGTRTLLATFKLDSALQRWAGQRSAASRHLDESTTSFLQCLHYNGKPRSATRSSELIPARPEILDHIVTGIPLITSLLQQQHHPVCH